VWFSPCSSESRRVAVEVQYSRLLRVYPRTVSIVSSWDDDGVAVLFPSSSSCNLRPSSAA